MNFVSEQGLCYFLPGWQVHLWVCVCSSISIHIENLLFWLVCLAGQWDNGSVLPGRRWEKSQLAAHQFGRLSSSVLPGGKRCCISGLIQCRLECSFLFIITTTRRCCWAQHIGMFATDVRNIGAKLQLKDLHVHFHICNKISSSG